ncbi:MAG TPA: hypothetical protein ENG05_02260 [Acidilobales archaeon]|nr:hypothetical protein [Acidilobales archaeon]
MSTSRRLAVARKVVGKKVVKGKTYTYEYYTLPLNLYLPKSMVEKWGTEYIVERREDEGTIIIRSKKALEESK